MQTVIHTPTNRLENSLDFYKKLGFKQLSEKSVLFTDGKGIVEINPDRYARAGLKLYRDSWESRLETLSKLTKVIKNKSSYLLSDPSGVWIYLEEESAAINFTPEEKSFSVLGNFAGLSLETVDLDQSAAFYQALGFEPAGGSTEHGYLVFQSNDFTISLMKPMSCPHLFFNPSFTYFNGGKNLPVIEKIRSLDIPITEEITYFNEEGIVDNIIIRDPGGYGFFVFND